MIEAENIRNQRIPEHLSSISNVPIELSKVMNDIQHTRRELSSSELALLIFGKEFRMGEARFVLAYANEMSLEKVYQAKRDQRNYDELDKATKQREQAEDALLDGVDGGLKGTLMFIAEELFGDPKNVLKVQMLAIGGRALSSKIEN